MSRMVHFYVIPKQVWHDKTKTICIDLEQEIEEEECLKKIEQIVKLKKLYSFSDALRISERIAVELAAEHYISHLRSDEWCVKCSLFVHGAYGCNANVNSGVNPLVVEGYRINYSYDNSYWSSIFSFINFKVLYNTSYFLNKAPTETYEVRLGGEVEFLNMALNTFDVIPDDEPDNIELTLHLFTTLKKYNNERYLIFVDIY